MSRVTPKRVHFDLRTPCKDCPFRKDVPHHEGVAGDLIPLLTALTGTGDVMHSCHKTDTRSDCESAKKFRGEMQHCAGFMIMALKAKEPTLAMLIAKKRGELRFEDLDMKAPVFTHREMAESYRDWLLNSFKKTAIDR